jgi:hypothetical protein
MIVFMDLLLELIYSTIDLMFMSFDSIMGSIVSVAIGFVPTLVGLEIAWKVGTRAGKGGQKVIGSSTTANV